MMAIAYPVIVAGDGRRFGKGTASAVPQDMTKRGGFSR
jgi:hypothetical protein